LPAVAWPAVALAASADPAARHVSADTSAEYSLWDMPARAQLSTGERSLAAARLVWTPPPVAASDRDRPTPRPRPRASPPPVKSIAYGRQDACSGAEGLVASAMCVLNPCKNPRARKSVQCVDRQRAEEARLARMAWR
jgi:hypothetical protein